MNTDKNSNPSGYLLLYRGKDWTDDLTTEQLKEALDRFQAWSEALAQSGKIKAGQALARQGRTLSRQNGRVIVDGPFVEGKETIGGYMLLDVDDLDEAEAIARSCPGLDYGGSIEIRPALSECPTIQRAMERLAVLTA